MMSVPDEVFQWVVTGLVAYGGIKAAIRTLESRTSTLEKNIRRLENHIFGTKDED